MKKILFTVLLSLGINSFAMDLNPSRKRSQVEAGILVAFAIEVGYRLNKRLPMSAAIKAAEKNKPRVAEYFMDLAGKTTLEECREGCQEIDNRATIPLMKSMALKMKESVKQGFIAKARSSGRQDVVDFIEAHSGLPRRS
jgi:nitrogenase subunit NifH